MDLLTVIFTYFLVWWIVLFTTLPLGVRLPDQVEKGNDIGAPARHDMKKKVIITSLISVVVTLVIYLIAESGVIDFREMSKGLE